MLETSPSLASSRTADGPRVALITLTFNGMPYLEAHLESLLNQDYANVKIVAVDNGSVDGTPDFLQRNLPPSAVLIQNRKNAGCAPGYNQGAGGSADCDILCFLNQDTVLDQRFCTAVVARLAIRDSVAVQPLVMFLSQPELVENCGHSVDLWMTTKTNGHQLAYAPGSVPSGLLVTLTAPAIYRTAFDRLGGFDEALFTYYEDTDLSLRIWESAGRIAFEPTAVVYHVQAGSATHFSDAWRSFLYARNRIRLLWKHSDSLNGAVRTLAVVVGGILVALVLLPRRPAEAVAIFKGIWWNLSHGKENEAARRQVMQHRVLSTRQLIERGIVQTSGAGVSMMARAVRLIG